MAFAAPGPIVDRITPQPPLLGPATTGIEHRQRRIIGEQLGRGQYRADDQLIQRRQPPAGPAHPVAQRGSVQRHPLACQHLRLAIQRKTIAELAHHHMHDQRLGRHAAIDRPLWRRRHHGNTVAAVAYVARPTRDAHPQLRRRDVELLGAQFAHHLQQCCRSMGRHDPRYRSPPHSAAGDPATHHDCDWARASLRLRCLPAAASAASWPAWFAATVCSRSSSPNCS